ncbi:MAG: NAD-dependent epimerase/dehydratase family protein [Ilumatobacteraceae bacterium]
MATKTDVLELPSRDESSFGVVSPRHRGRDEVCRIVVTGASWPLGRRVVERLRSDSGPTTFDVREARAGESLETFDVLIHLAPGDHDALAARGRSAAVGTPEILEQATRAGVRYVLVLSSAMVYGAWPNNPIPLTEEATLRPDFGFAFARQLATVEQLVDDWGQADPQRRTCVLRPVPAMAADGTSSLVRALAAGMGGRLGVDDVPAQFVHLDDLADAVVLCVTKELPGVYNVSPDGYVPGSRVRALSGMSPRLRLPDRLGEFVADLRWRFQRGPIPPGLRPYVRSPWLVSNGRLRAAGWSPTVTSEQAFVEGTDAKWWTMLTPKRKQELALGAMVAALVVGLLSAMWFVRRRR